LQKIARNPPLLLTIAVITLAGCAPREEPVAETAPTIAAAPAYNCGRGGFVKAQIVGAVATSLDWHAEVLDCEGMPRPEGQGARLRFSGPGDGAAGSMALIIALPDLPRGDTGKEFATNATLVIEGSGRFFSTSNDDVCWTDVTRQEPLSGDRYAISGSLYCIAPLVEVNGSASVSIPELRFSGLLDWGTS